MPVQNEVVITKPQAPKRRKSLALTEHKVENRIKASLYGPHPEVADDSATSGHVIDVSDYVTQGGARSVNHFPESGVSSWASYGSSQQATKKASGHVVEVKGYARHDGMKSKARSSKQSNKSAYGPSRTKSTPGYQSSGKIIDIRGNTRHPGIRRAQRVPERKSYGERPAPASAPAPYGQSIIAPNLSQNQPWGAKPAAPANHPKASNNQIDNHSSWTVYNRRVDEPTEHSTEVVQIRGPSRHKHTPLTTQPKPQSKQQSLYDKRAGHKRTTQSIQAIGVRNHAKQGPQLQPKVPAQPRAYGPPMPSYPQHSYPQPHPYSQPNLYTQPSMPSYIKSRQVQRPTRPGPPNRSHITNRGYSNPRHSTTQPAKSQPSSKVPMYNPAKAAFMAFKATSPTNSQSKPQKPYSRPQPRPAYSYGNHEAYAQQQPAQPSQTVGMRAAKSGSGQVRPGDAKTGPALPTPKKQNLARPQLKPFQFKPPKPVVHRHHHNNAIGIAKQNSPYTDPAARTVNYLHPNSINPLPTLNHPAAHLRSYKPPVSLLNPHSPVTKSLIPLSRPPAVVAKPPSSPRPPRTFHHVARHLPPANPQHNQVTPHKSGLHHTGKYGKLQFY